MFKPQDHRLVEPLPTPALIILLGAWTIMALWAGAWNVYLCDGAWYTLPVIFTYLIAWVVGLALALYLLTE
ncbi:hypothetical protein LCGC14_1608390 [marine sediment metagenome]|uniref:Uncharacterized protein n=1 Tax=marine sediment metagenome TaxID=412755 RepID=A0A0F9L9A8_9ZZZZ